MPEANYMMSDRKIRLATSGMPKVYIHTYVALKTGSRERLNLPRTAPTA